MIKEYKTVFKNAVAEHEEKKSRFITSIRPVSCEEEALAFISKIKTKYWDASHNVYSYEIGGNNVIQRFSDDGEPTGTAGLPILEVIKRMELKDIVIVVTRYFGGTLLGASGLIRSYSRSACLGIEAALVIHRLLCIEVSMVLEYTLFGKVQNLLISHDHAVKNISYGQDVEITVFVPLDDITAFIEMITEATNARALIEQGEKTYISLDMNRKLII